MKSRVGRGFTLLEILVVISIIGILSSVAFVSYNQAREKGFMGKRIASASEVRKALEVYYSENESYPVTGTRWMSDSCVAYRRDDWIPGLVAGGYIHALPTDPEYTDPTSNKCCYLYRSNGADYKLIFGYQCDSTRDGGPVPDGLYLENPSLIDPQRDSGYDSCAQESDVGTVFALAYYTPGGCGW